ncbi:hypothetical protein [Mycobacteroides abscessus]|uniref:hypothetical protein n=1 Tax=Mycobacteroides abscessus TaxID=36809 RepID=UPI000925C72C|nr:hypothetical protein [Mycobacteroides abscessus]SHW64479.1 Uncharacterised protein [Mycobacteroides abscessus subsp. abscessus]SHZ89534.1 Uncharacterised protein [Mycobacteroides abscessus subsp. abscessus]SKQ83075.1 Uncharacterised protein [Mycobacteroides abscessus subsp. abscessus]
MTTTHTIEVFALSDAEESDPDPYFVMTYDDTALMLEALIEMWGEDHDDFVTLCNERPDECDPTVIVYDVCANDAPVAIAYVAHA